MRFLIDKTEQNKKAIPVAENFSPELAEANGFAVVDLEVEEGQTLLSQQSDHIAFQFKLSFLADNKHAGRKKFNV